MDPVIVISKPRVAQGGPSYRDLSRGVLKADPVIVMGKAEGCSRWTQLS